MSLNQTIVVKMTHKSQSVQTETSSFQEANADTNTDTGGQPDGWSGVIGGSERAKKRCKKKIYKKRQKTKKIQQQEKTMYSLGASMQMWLHLNQKLFGLKCFFNV